MQGKRKRFGDEKRAEVVLTLDLLVKMGKILARVESA